MLSEEDGHFTTTVTVKTDKTYSYKFVVDGEWKHDPDKVCTSDDCVVCSYLAEGPRQVEKNCLDAGNSCWVPWDTVEPGLSEQVWAEDPLTCLSMVRKSGQFWITGPDAL